MSGRGWIGVDLDGTLAHYEGWQGADHIGEPIPLMLDRVRKWLDNGEDVRIFTARVSHDGSLRRVADALLAEHAIVAWCVDNFGRELPVTNVKDYEMRELWDDRAITVEQNTGRAVGQRQERFTP